MKIYSDVCKSVSSVSLVTLSLLQLAAGIYLYISGYTVVAVPVVPETALFPGFELGFSPFALYVWFSVVATAVVLALGLVAAQAKKPYTAFAFLIIASGSGILMLCTASIAFRFKDFTPDVCQSTGADLATVQTIQAQYASLVDAYMCTPACPCYAGAIDATTGKGEIQSRWEAYGAAKFEAFGRTTDPTNKPIPGPNTHLAVNLVNASPLAWRSTAAGASRTFQACYEQVLKPQNKYFGAKAAQAAEFFKPDGAYDFLVAAETTLSKHYNSKCSLICKTPMFALTRPVADGMPAEECMGAAVKATLASAESVAWTLTFTSGITLATLFCVCGVCTPYSSTDNSIAAMAHDKMQELGLMSDSDDAADKENQSTIVIDTGRGKEKA